MNSSYAVYTAVSLR